MTWGWRLTDDLIVVLPKGYSVPLGGCGVLLASHTSFLCSHGRNGKLELVVGNGMSNCIREYASWRSYPAWAK